MPVKITGNGRRLWDGTGGARLVATSEWVDNWKIWRKEKNFEDCEDLKLLDSYKCFSDLLWLKACVIDSQIVQLLNSFLIEYFFRDILSQDNNMFKHVSIQPCASPSLSVSFSSPVDVLWSMSYQMEAQIVDGHSPRLWCICLLALVFSLYFLLIQPVKADGRPPSAWFCWRILLLKWAFLTSQSPNSPQERELLTCCWLSLNSPRSWPLYVMLYVCVP